MRYRERAVTPLSEIRRSARLPHLVGVPSVLLVAIAAVAVVTVFAWAWLGNVETRVSGTGILIREPGLTGVEAPTDGLVADMLISAGDIVEEGTPLVVLRTDEGATVTVESLVDGAVSATSTSVGSVVRFGQRLATLEPVEGPLAATIFVDALEAAQIEPGMEAFVWPLGTSPAEEGATIGVVSGVETFPATVAQLESVLQAAPLVASLSTTPVVEVTVQLGEEDQLDWTLADPSSSRARPGHVVEAWITVSSRRPIDAIVGWR